MKKYTVHSPQSTVHSNRWLVILIVFLTIHYSLFTNRCYSQVSISNDPNATPDPSAILDVSGTGYGVLISRMFEGEKPSSPDNGLLIYNKTSQCFEVYTNNTWYKLSCPVPCEPPADFGYLGTDNISSNSFTISWQGRIGETWKYKPWPSFFLLDISTSSDFSTYETANGITYHNYNIGVPSCPYFGADPYCKHHFTVTGLQAGTTYYVRVRGSNGSCSTNYATTGNYPTGNKYISITTAH
jgi:hypothetical protein